MRAVRVTGPYRWHRAIRVRLSLVDHGLTFGSTVARGVCLLFREPVRGIDPLGLLRHPGLTLTVAEPARFAGGAEPGLPPGVLTEQLGQAGLELVGSGGHPGAAVLGGE